MPAPTPYQVLTDPDQCRRLWEKYGTVRGVARALDCHPGTARKWLERAGIDITAGGGQPEEPVAEAEPSLEDAIAAEAVNAKERSQKRLLQELLRERSRTEILAEKLVDAVRALPSQTIPPPQPSGGPYDPEEPVLLIGDVQGGQKTDLEETGGLGEYNLDIFHRQLETLFAKVQRITEIHRRAYELPRLHLWFLGDIVDGETIFPGQVHEIEQGVVDQVTTMANAFARFIVRLLYVYPRIDIRAIYGNHGRVGKKGEAQNHTNWDYVLYRFMEARTANYSDRISWHIPKSWWDLAEVCGWGFLLVHGDDIKAWNSIPYYGLNRADARWTKLLQSRGRAYHYLVCGHHHNPAQIDTTGGELIMNGAWPGMSLYSLKRLQLASRPSQLFFGVHPRQGKTWTYKLHLDDYEEAG